MKDIEKLKEYVDGGEGVSIDGINTDEVLNKINEIIEYINSKKDQLL